MGQKYSGNSTSGYNSTPPSDDGTVAEDNKVKWSTIKTKLSDPVKTLAETIDSELTTHFDHGPTALTSNTTLDSTHYEKFIQVSSSGVTLTFTDAATLGTGWNCWIRNTDSSNNVTLGRATGGDTFNGSASNYTLRPGEALHVYVNAAANGFLTANRAFGNAQTIGGKITAAGGIDMSGTAINFAEGSDVASAGTCDIWSTTGNTVHVTGSTGPITSFGTAPQAGATRRVIIDSTPTITHGANLILPGSVNRTAEAGDSFEVYADTTTQLRVFNYTKADGTPLVNPSGTSLVYISSQTASTSAALTFTSGITSTYDKYILDIVDLLPATDNIDIWFEVSENAGSSWVTSNSYAWVYDDTGSNAGSNATANWAIALGVDNTSDYGGISGTVEIFNPAGSKYKKGKCDISSNGNTNTQEYLAGYGIYRSTSAVNGFRIKAASGNLTSGVIHMYGVKKS